MRIVDQIFLPECRKSAFDFCNGRSSGLMLDFERPFAECEVVRTPHAALDRVNELFCERFRDFDTIAAEELGNSTFDCCVVRRRKGPWCKTQAVPAPESRFHA
jgi:hypothetical protein